MKTRIQQPKQESRTIQSKTKAANQASISQILQYHKQPIVQLGGSHNKDQMLIIRSYRTRNRDGDVTEHDKINHTYKLGKIKGHTPHIDWDDYVKTFVRKNYDLRGEVLIDVSYGTRSKQ
jgi:hypothetical protein